MVIRFAKCEGPAYESTDFFSSVKWVCSHMCIIFILYIRFCSEIGFPFSLVEFMAYA